MIKSTKANALFLATVLVAGIIALTYPSILVEAQATREKYVMDPKYNRHEPDHGSDYGMDSDDNKKPYENDRSHSTDYGMDSYDNKKPYENDRSHSTDYGMDSYDNKKPYENDRSHSTDYGMNSV